MRHGCRVVEVVHDRRGIRRSERCDSDAGEVVVPPVGADGASTVQRLCDGVDPEGVGIRHGVRLRQNEGTGDDVAEVNALHGVDHRQLHTAVEFLGDLDAHGIGQRAEALGGEAGRRPRKEPGRMRSPAHIVHHLGVTVMEAIVPSTKARVFAPGLSAGKDPSASVT